MPPFVFEDKREQKNQKFDFRSAKYFLQYNSIMDEI